MGLTDSHHISKIIVHPENSDIVYIASMGHLFTTNAERGVFKTINGGKTWSKVFYIDEKIGIIDLVMDPSQPDILYAAAYEKIRLPWHYEAGGEVAPSIKLLWRPELEKTQWWLTFGESWPDWDRHLSTEP